MGAGQLSLLWCCFGRRATGHRNAPDHSGISFLERSLKSAYWGHADQHPTPEILPSLTHICLRQFASASAYHSLLRHSRAEIGYRSHDDYSGWIMKPARGKWTARPHLRVGRIRAIEMLSADSPTSSPLTGTLPVSSA